MVGMTVGEVVERKRDERERGEIKRKRERGVGGAQSRENMRGT